MDIEDVKVGMLVQMNDSSSRHGSVGEVESIDYWDGLVMLRLEGVTTDSQHNTSTIHNRWNVKPYCFDEYQDPEADMIVWDALEVGEHFYKYGDIEYVKVSKTHAIPLGEHYPHQFTPHTKVSLVPTK